MTVTHKRPASLHDMGPKILFGLVTLLRRDMEIVPITEADHRTTHLPVMVAKLFYGSRGIL